MVVDTKQYSMYIIGQDNDRHYYNDGCGYYAVIYWQNGSKNILF